MGGRMDQACFNILASSRRAQKEELSNILKEAGASDSSFADLVVKSGLISENEMLSIFSKSFGIPFVHLKSLQIDTAVFQRIPIKFAEYYKFFPLKLEGRSLTVAVSRLLDVNTLDEMRLGLGFEIKMSLAIEKDIQEMLKKYYGLGAQTVSKIIGQTDAMDSNKESTFVLIDEVEDIEKLAETASVGQLVNQIILDGYRNRASDIHIEPFHGHVRVRYRVDGKLKEAAVSPEMKRFLFPILSRIKIMANLNIVEKRLPQDGKARVKTQDQVLDLRVSSIPTPHGESMVIRILRGKMVFGLEQLGFEDHQTKVYDSLIKKPNGIIFVTGPTGSGKSTTLYAGLNLLNEDERKIITIEDPIEYELEGVTQIQVESEIGLTFAKGLRSMLRHDPDVMMVGEVRDLETAEIAIRVALTGHLVLSTLHTNDAASGVARLLEMGVEPFLVSSSVNAFIAQRLVRKICSHCCIEDHEVPAHLIEEVIFSCNIANTDKHVKFFVGEGCDQCSGTGYCGRTAIYEMLVVNEEIRKLILLKASASEIKSRACQMGMRTLRQDGWHKVLAGVTTVREVLESAPEDELLKNQATTHKLAEEVHVDSGLKVVVPGEETLEYSSPKMIEMPKVKKAKRSYDRLSADFKISYKIVELESQEGLDSKKEQKIRERKQSDFEIGVGKAKNVSASGVCFICQRGLDPGDVLEVNIGLPDDDVPIECIGRVVRSNPVVSVKEAPNAGVIHEVAVTFLGINSSDRIRIERFCRDGNKS
jgi:type II secretory ATPase GspE/PulE/Tfp pilus assembly ATPase PilB-like protein